MELEIQKYLRSGKTLKDLSIEFDIKFFESELHPNLVVFDYSKFSPSDSQIVQEARGLILQKNTWNLAAISMKKFGQESKSFNWLKSQIMPKFDGCLVVLYFYENEWITGTRFSVDGDCYVASAFKNLQSIKWSELFKSTIENFLDTSYEDFLLNLNKDQCYSFELCSLSNQNVILYKDNFAKLLAIYNKADYREIDIFKEELFLNLYPQLIPESITISNYGDVQKILQKNNNPYEVEGFVGLDENFNRIKILNSKYVNLVQNLSPKTELDELLNIVRTMDISANTQFKCYVDTNAPTGSGIQCWDMSTTQPPNAVFGSVIYSSCFAALAGCDIPVVSWCLQEATDPYGSVCVWGTVSAPYTGIYTNPPYSSWTLSGPYYSTNCMGTCLGTAPPSGGGGGGGGAMSIMSDSSQGKGCSTSWNPKSTNVSNPSSIIELCNWYLTEYGAYKSGNNDLKDILINVWEEAFTSLESGFTMSYILTHTSSESILQAAKKFAFK
jgi:hypothetical protein